MMQQISHLPGITGHNKMFHFGTLLSAVGGTQVIAHIMGQGAICGSFSWSFLLHQVSESSHCWGCPVAITGVALTAVSVLGSGTLPGCAKHSAVST